MKSILKYISVFILVITIFNIVLFFTSLFPSSWIEQNVKNSAIKLYEEGNLYEFSERFRITNNNYTDALMINEAYSIDNRNPIYSYMAVRKNYKENQTQKEMRDQNGETITINNGEICKGESYDTVGELKEFIEGKTEVSITYARYWHGYLPILRTALILFNVIQIRYVLLLIFIILLIYSYKLINKKLGKDIAIIFVSTLIVEGYFFVSYSLESSPVFMVMMISTIILLKRIEKIEDFYLYIFIIAMITNFVDYLTVPLITLAMPLYMYILYIQNNSPNPDTKYCFKIIFKSAVIWGIGYSLTWFCKWLLYDVIYEQNFIKSAIYQVLYRSGGNASSLKTYFKGILSNLIFQNICYTFIHITIWALVFICKNIIKSHKRSFKKETIHIKKLTPILVISGFPIVWFIILTNHTTVHVRFTYRNMIIFLFGLLICINEILNVLYKNINKDNKTAGIKDRINSKKS